MACPFFEPRKKSSRATAFRLPLGTFWEGVCHSQSGDVWEPDEDTQLDCCNYGYAHGRCPQFPADAEADAVRFVHRNGETLFILEKEHIPLRYGPVSGIEPHSILDKQTRAWQST